MKLALILMLIFSNLSSFASSVEVLNDKNIYSQLDILHKYNTLRNKISPQIPELNTRQMRVLLKQTKKMKKDMGKYPDIFNQGEISKTGEFIDQIEKSIIIRNELKSCELDAKYDLTKNDLSVYSDYSLMGELNEKCRNQNLESFSFPEINSIKDVGIYMVRKELARGIHQAAFQKSTEFYINTIDKYSKKPITLEELFVSICGNKHTHCSAQDRNTIRKNLKNKNKQPSFPKISTKDKFGMVKDINGQIKGLNEQIKKLRNSAKENESFFTVGGNDFLINCRDEDSKDLKLYREYQKQIETLISPSSKQKNAKMNSELVVTMLYDKIGKPAKSETECSEEGFYEITLNEDHHNFIGKEDLNDASRDIISNAKNMVRKELDDYSNGDNPIDYIGEKAFFSPHLVGPILARNPETAMLVCSGLKDYQFDEKVKTYAYNTAMALTALTAFTGVGGLGLMALRTALWASGKSIGNSAIRSIAKSGITRFSKRNANLLLNSKGAILGYGAVTASEVATLQYLRRDKEKQVLNFENQILSMPNSSSKDRLLEEYNKVSEMNFDFYLSVGFGVFDITAVIGMLKMSKNIDESKANEMANLLRQKRLQMEELINNPSYEPLTGLKLLLPENEYNKLMVELNTALDVKQLAEFSTNLKLNLLTEKGDFLKALEKSVVESKLSIEIPRGNELNQRVLDELPLEDKAEFILTMENKYRDLIKKYQFDSAVTREEFASLVYLLEKSEGFRSRNVPWEVQKQIVSEKLDKLMTKECN